jgi:hypothetical protein
MTATNMRLLISETRGDSNWFTPCRGKSDQHATCFPRSVRIWSKTIHISHGPHIATLREMLIDLDKSHCSREKGPPTQSTACRLTDLWVRTQFLSWANQWSRGISQAPIGDPLLGLSGPYHRHAIGMFNTCSRGPTHQSLINIGGGYNLGGAGLPHTTPRPSQPAISTFHLRASPGLQFNQVPTTKPKCWVY